MLISIRGYPIDRKNVWRYHKDAEPLDALTDELPEVLEELPDELEELSPAEPLDALTDELDELLGDKMLGDELHRFYVFNRVERVVVMACQVGDHGAHDDGCN